MYIFDATMRHGLMIMKSKSPNEMELQMIQQMLARQHKIMITRDWMKFTLNRYIDYGKCF